MNDRVLVIDDVRTFDFPATYARTSYEGIKALKENNYDEVWLDHDLGMLDGTDDTIKRVVLYLEYLAHRGTPYPATIVVHTANPVGRNMIVAALSKDYEVRVVWADTYISLPFG